MMMMDGGGRHLTTVYVDQMVRNIGEDRLVGGGGKIVDYYFGNNELDCA